MPGNRDLSSLPMPMQNLVQLLKDKALINEPTEVTKQMIMTDVPREIRTKCYSNLGYQLRKHFPEKHPKYQECISPEESAEWLASFIVTPADGGGITNVSHEVKRERIFERATMMVWLTSDQLSGPQFMNSLEHAQIMTSAGDMPERKSSYASLAARGILEYQHTISSELAKKLISEGVISKAQCDIDPEDQESFNQELLDFENFGPGAAAGSRDQVASKAKGKTATTRTRTAAEPKAAPANAEGVAEFKASAVAFNKARGELMSQYNKMTSSAPSGTPCCEIGASIAPKSVLPMLRNRFFQCFELIRYDANASTRDGASAVPC